MDEDLRSIQEARDLVRAAGEAQHRFKTFSQEQVDRIVTAMAEAGAAEAERLGRLAHDETGFGRIESKAQKNLFATKTLLDRMHGMKTVGIIRKTEGDTIWEVATPMGVVAALIPSTNPTSTAMYKAIISAKARCGIVMSPHPRARRCTAEALRVVAEAAYTAGAPQGLFGCLTEVTLAGTDALLEHADTDVILATGGSAMVRAAYSKGKPAYGVGSGNVPVYVDRSADVEKAAADLLAGASFDWGTLCSTERSIVADAPISQRLKQALKARGGYFMNENERQQVRDVILRDGRLNVDQVGQSPERIATMAGFSVPPDTLALIGEATVVGKDEPLSMETLSPILAYYVEDGWQAGCERSIEVLHFGGIGHTLGLHCTSAHVIEAFALQKPAMRIVVNTIAALGSVGYTNRLFPSMTLGPGTLGGSITSDNISPLHLINVKRLAFETDPVNPLGGATGSSVSAAGRSGNTPPARAHAVNGSAGWMHEIEERLIARAGNPVSARPAPARRRPVATGAAPVADAGVVSTSELPLPEAEIERIIRQFKK